MVKNVDFWHQKGLSLNPDFTNYTTLDKSTSLNLLPYL